MTVVLLVFFICYFFIISKKNLDTPSKTIITLFSAYWAFSLIVSSIGVYGIDIPHLKTYIIFIINIISFTFGFLTINIRSKANVNKDHLLLLLKSMSNNKWIIILACISAIYVLSKVAIYRNAIIVGETISSLRSEYYSSETNLFGSEFPYVNLFLTAIFVYLAPLFSYLSFHKRGFLWVIIGLFLLGYVFIGGGRFGYVRIVLAIVFFELVLKVSSIKTSKLIVTFSSIAVALFVLFAIVSGGRRGEIDAQNAFEAGRDIALEQIVTYSSGPITAFDKSLEYDYVRKIGGFQYGRLTFSAIDVFINMVASHILGVSTQPALSKLSFKQDSPIKIGPNYVWNALYTCLLFFYLDFGILGAIFPPFFIGLLFRKFITCLYKRPSYSIIVIVFYFFRETMFSVIDYGFTSPIVFLMLVVLFIQWRYSKNV